MPLLSDMLIGEGIYVFW